jgi:DnaJ-domain-containing protein 1
MISPEQVRQLLRTLAAHPVLPAMDRLPANGEALHAVLADLAGGERSGYAQMLGHVATEAGIRPEELARRAEFLLACLILPRAGTHYEMLGVPPSASPEEIRKRWATLIQRYHPDHFDRSDSWVADQARRLIEAYQTLREPERRRRYDEALARERAAQAEQRRPGSAVQLMRKPRRSWRRWVPAALMVVGLAGFSSLYVLHPPPPLPQAALPPAPKLLEGQQRPTLLNPLVLPSSPRPDPAATEKAAEPEPSPPKAPERRQEPAPESSWRRARLSAPQTPHEMPGRTATQHETSSAAAITKMLRTLTVSDGSSQETTPVVRSKSPPRPAVQAPPPVKGPGEFSREWSPPVGPEGLLPEEVSTATPKAVSPPPAAATIAPDRMASRVVPLRVMPPEDDPLHLIETFRAAYERKDLGAMMRLFASAPREQEAVGRSAVQARYARNFDVLDQIHYELSRLETMAPATNDSLVVRGWFHIRAVRRENPSQFVDAAGPVRWLLRREGNTLRIAEIHYELSRR